MAGLVRGKLGIVTGGGSGLGRAICQRLAENGASLVVVDLRKETAQETVDLLSKGTTNFQIPKILSRFLASKEGQHYAFACDVGKREQIENLKSFFVEKFKKSPDLVVNNAGITKDTWLLKMTDEQFDDVINVNLKAVYMVLMCKRTLPHTK